MDKDEVLARLLRAFAVYYDLNRENPQPPFVAEASFHSHDDAYFLVHGAVIGEAESNEYVFFAQEEELSEERLRALAHLSWERGLARVRPHGHHRNTDISLLIVADSVSASAAEAVKSLRYYKSYRLSLRGFSHFRLLVLDLAAKKIYCNRQGAELKKNLRGII